MAQYLNLREDYDALQTRVERALRVMIAESKHISKHRDVNALRIDHIDYVEIAIQNDRLILLDVDGYDYDLSVVTLDELIDIITQ